MKIAILVQGGTILSVRADTEAIDLDMVDADLDPDDSKSRWPFMERELSHEIPT
jgi:hypothetical protein